MAQKRVAIYDMDGTIVCSLHRYRTITRPDGVQVIDLEYWRENEHKALGDSLLPLASQYKADLADPDCVVIIATARVLHGPDMDFIHNTLGKPNYIIARPEGSSVSGGVLKVNGLRKILNLKQYKNRDIVFYEDNIQYLKRVCDTFRIRGVYVPSLQGH